MPGDVGLGRGRRGRRRRHAGGLPALGAEPGGWRKAGAAASARARQRRAALLAELRARKRPGL